VRLLLKIVCASCLLSFAWPCLGQVNTGELRLKVTGPMNAALIASIEIVGQGSEYRISISSNQQGDADIRRVPFGLYLLSAQSRGFKTVSQTVEVRSAIPIEYAIKLEMATVNSVVKVDAAATLIDPNRPSAMMQIGTKQIEDRSLSLPGRSLQDLVNTQPGWLYEGNAVLHPRGSEYQTQFVIDGIPLTDNRSPGFGPEIGADDLESMSIYTAGFPAEYGRKMGGVVEINTRQDPQPGLHGMWSASGGTYDVLGTYGQVEQTWGKNLLGATVSEATSKHFLNPVVPQNLTNRGTTGDYSAKYERDFTPSDRLILSVRHELSHFDIPNELVQQQAGQLQTGDNAETIGSVSYRHIFSTDSLGSIQGMVRENADDLNSNTDSTPIVAFQHNHFREFYTKGMFFLHRGNHEFKIGGEVDSTFLHENFNYLIADPSQFDPVPPATLSFLDSRPDLEQAAFAEDLIRLGKWTIGAGLRWDQYQLILNQNALSPRLSVGWYFPPAKAVFHASFDRVFQTPSFENILISSSPQIDALSDRFLRLPVRPSRGNYYEAGVAKAFAGRIRMDVNAYRRDVSNYADDDQLLNTGVSYPIAFDRSVVYGAEGKLEVVRLGNLTGFVSYSYMVDSAWFPVTGGLFLGVDATNALSQLNGRFPGSQDQRNTLRSRFQYQCFSRMWLASGFSYGSGLPFTYGGSQADALAQYGPAVVSRINFGRGRIRPLLAVNAALEADLYKNEKVDVSLQAGGDNLNNRLNVLDFGGLFSGNAIAPGRSFSLRLTTRF